MSGSQENELWNGGRKTTELAQRILRRAESGRDIENRLSSCLDAILADQPGSSGIACTVLRADVWLRSALKLRS